jgi:hypothetical protein
LRLFDVASIVSAAAVNFWGTATAGNGVIGWLESTTGIYARTASGVCKRIVSGDLSAGILTVRPYYKISAGSMTFFTDSGVGYSPQMHVVNWGPQPYVWG